MGFVAHVCENIGGGGDGLSGIIGGGNVGCLHHGNVGFDSHVSGGITGGTCDGGTSLLHCGKESMYGF